MDEEGNKLPFFSTYSHYRNLLKMQIPKWECSFISIYLCDNNGVCVFVR